VIGTRHQSVFLQIPEAELEMLAWASEQILQIVEVQGGFVGLVRTLGVEQIQNAFALGFLRHLAYGRRALVEDPPASLTISVQVNVVSGPFFRLAQQLV